MRLINFALYWQRNGVGIFLYGALLCRDLLGPLLTNQAGEVGIYVCVPIDRLFLGMKMGIKFVRGFSPMTYMPWPWP